MLRVRQVKIDILNDTEEKLKEKVALKLKVKQEDIKYISILKKSIDARDKKDIHYVYEVKVSVINENKIKRNSDITSYEEKTYHAPLKGEVVLEHRPVIIGSGPAGLFCAYILAENGYQPIVIERGKMVYERQKDVEEFWEKGILNKNSNVQFGEGGAGTFSDGKLNTMIKDPECLGKKVLETFVKYGAPEEILYLNKPHIGTDKLIMVVENMRKAIIEMGGSFYYSTTFMDFNVDGQKVKEIFLDNGEKMDTDVLVLALGHSAKDTFTALSHKLQMEAKPFAVGIRISHKQKMINENQYADMAKYLPPADYKLTYKAKNGRGVYSFCMCPGGFVVNSSSEAGRLVINGMSNYARDEENANCALIVTISPDDFGYHPLDGLAFQRNLEQKAFNAGKGSIPVQRYKDYLQNQDTAFLGSIRPVYKGKFTLANINDIFPDYINDSLKEAIEYFGTKIKGFNDPDSLISAVESRTSSPVRIIRDEKLESSIKGIYPCGEGAGYAGGITSSAIDGIKVAHAIIKKYHM